MKADILNPKWPYTNSAETDLKRTFARVRREMAEAAKRQAQEPKKVLPIKRGEATK